MIPGPHKGKDDAKKESRIRSREAFKRYAAAGQLPPRTIEHLRTGALSTGDVSAICRVAPRTVTKWIDAGYLKGTRVPMSPDRRVTLQDLYAFMQQHGLSTTLIDRYVNHKIVVVGFDPATALQIMNSRFDSKVHEAATAFNCGYLVATVSPHALIVDVEAVGRQESITLVTEVMKCMAVKPLCVAVIGEDDPGVAAYRYAGYAGVTQKPFDVRALTPMLRNLSGE